jgi:hypothetical protein
VAGVETSALLYIQLCACHPVLHLATYAVHATSIQTNPQAVHLLDLRNQYSASIAS